jgi:hypothetical protein
MFELPTRRQMVCEFLHSLDELNSGVSRSNHRAVSMELLWLNVMLTIPG